MTISLTKDLEALIEKQLESGRYQSRAEVIEEALELLDTQTALEEAKLARLRADIQVGLESGTAEPLDMDAILDEAHRQHGEQFTE